ncbi:hypothetical protein PG985_014788 [Apiospora marii]|uniref:uncharacterized protein n=1 Tax=Apiospora marii TaxID=335849 RepID=UPI00312D0E9D
MADDTPMQDAPAGQPGSAEPSTIATALDDTVAAAGHPKAKRLAYRWDRKPEPRDDDNDDEEGPVFRWKRRRVDSQSTNALPVARRPRFGVAPRPPPVPTTPPEPVSYTGDDILAKAESMRNGLPTVIRGADNVLAVYETYMAKEREDPRNDNVFYDFKLRKLTDVAAVRRYQKAVNYSNYELDAFDEWSDDDGNGNDNNGSDCRRRERGARPASLANKKAGAAVDEARLKADAIATVNKPNNNNNNNTGSCAGKFNPFAYARQSKPKDKVTKEDLDADMDVQQKFREAAAREGKGHLVLRDFDFDGDLDR